jgi:hypothetical protein
MLPVGGIYVESRHKRPIEESSDCTSSVSDHLWETTTTTDDANTTGPSASAALHSPKKRPRLQYRDHVDSFQSDESWQTEATANSALTGVAVAGGDQEGSLKSKTSQGQWVLRRNRSNISVSSTRTEVSEHEEATTVHANDNTSSISSPTSTPLSTKPGSLIMVTAAEINITSDGGGDSQQQQQQQQHYQGNGDGLKQQMESLTSRVENWSLTNLRALRRNNMACQDDSAAAASRRRQVQAAKRDVMRVLRRSNTSVNSVMSSCSDVA